ncbi:hypothetical protein C7999DRAFT_35123 [Corynascus novoguineensis]|uniref:Condensation domain-containing protein n=1 Tax=Corynascus novoguineensis TaxID=1126955 RepID=A0AAN7HJS4_9PEZI|nr:hypothetical protein C7999DRAFT_35123 [Corynascus novoguineensis]
MAWTETQPGLWQRPIGENEAMIKTIGDAGLASGTDVWSISATAHFAASVEPKSLAQALRDGWVALRFRHPSIAATADDDALHYHVPSHQQLTEWLEETFIVVHGESSVDHVLGTLPPRRYASCYYLEDANEVVLHLSHWHTDGIGAFYLLGALFRATINHLRDDSYQFAWGEETARLVPSVEHALNLPIEPTEAIEAATKKYLATVGHAKGALGIPPQPTGTGGNATRLPTFSFPADQTAELLSACAKQGIRFEAALHASVTAAAYSIVGPAATAPDSEHKQHHCSTLRHSLRPHLPAPYDGAPGAAGLYTAGFFVRAPGSHSWLDNARYFESEYAKGATPDLLISRRQYAREMRAILKRNLASPPPNPPPSGLDMSWVPDAEDLVGGAEFSASAHGDDEGGRFVRLDKVGISVDVLSRHVYVFAWIFNGQIQCRLAFNRAFYDDGFANRVLELVAHHLISNLSVASSS